jgi:hypothetical protein
MTKKKHEGPRRNPLDLVSWVCTTVFSGGSKAYVPTLEVSGTNRPKAYVPTQEIRDNVYCFAKNQEFRRQKRTYVP